MHAAKATGISHDYICKDCGADTTPNILAEVDLASCNLQELQRLAAHDRYVRYAHTRRRRASQKL
jgi:hypothetical protein